MTTQRKLLDPQTHAPVLQKPCCRVDHTAPLRGIRVGGSSACAHPCFTYITVVTMRYISLWQPIKLPQNWMKRSGVVQSTETCPCHDVQFTEKAKMRAGAKMNRTLTHLTKWLFYPFSTSLYTCRHKIH